MAGFDTGPLGVDRDVSGPLVEDASSTALLLSRARQGDRAALDDVFARQAQMLRRWASGRLPPWARGVTDTDDLIQDALLQTFKRLDEFDARGTGALNAYLRQAVINRLRDELRRQSHRPVALQPPEWVRAGEPSPLDRAIAAEAVARYERALDRLRPGEKECLVARLELGFSFEELAEWTHRPSADAARKATERALVRLVEEMDRLVSG
jgi:RNA polymerase sigma-70 factor (ECF subfamily)